MSEEPISRREPEPQPLRRAPRRPVRLQLLEADRGLGLTETLPIKSANLSRDMPLVPDQAEPHPLMDQCERLLLWEIEIVIALNMMES